MQSMSGERPGNQEVTCLQEGRLRAGAQVGGRHHFHRTPFAPFEFLYRGIFIDAKTQFFFLGVSGPA